MDLKLRRATDRDAVAVSALYLRARKAAKPTIPMTANTDDETRRWMWREASHPKWWKLTQLAEPQLTRVAARRLAECLAPGIRQIE